MRNQIWLWLLRFCYRQLRLPGTKMPTGIPGIRDPDLRCDGYAPTRPVTGMNYFKCEGDGHYLCRECVHHVVPEEEKL